jgi:ribosomal protein S3AE
MMLTGNIKKQDINVVFRVSAVKGDTAFTFLEKYELTPASIKRKVRRDRDRLDASFQCVTKDNKIIRLKPLVVTGVKASRLVKATLRNKVIQSIVSFVKKSDYDSLVMSIVTDKFQKELMTDISKIVPVRIATVRSMQLLGEQKESAEQKTEEKVKQSEEETAAVKV